MLKVLRDAVEVVVGRVGGLFKAPLVVEARDVDDGFVAEDMEVGLLVAVVPETGRLVVAEVGLFLAGEVTAFSLATSGLVTGSSPPERRVESTGVAGAALSDSTSAGGAASAGGCTASVGEGATSAGACTASDGGGTGSSVDAMMDSSSHSSSQFKHEDAV